MVAYRRSPLARIKLNRVSSGKRSSTFCKKKISVCDLCVTICVVSCCHQKFFVNSDWCSTYSEQRDQVMLQVVAYTLTRLKAKENCKTVSTKSARGRLLEGVV